jgi:exonuclease SbcC
MRAWIGDLDESRVRFADAEQRERKNHEDELRLAARLRDLQEKERGAKLAAEAAERALNRLRETEAEHARLDERLRSAVRDEERLRLELRAAHDAATQRVALLPKLATLPETEAAFARLESVAARAEEKRRLDALLEVMRLEIQGWEHEEARLRHELEPLRKAAAEASVLEADLEALRARRQESATHLARSEAEAAGVEAQHRDHAKRLSSLERLGESSPCPLCERPLLDVYGALTTATKEGAAALVRQRETLAARLVGFRKDDQESRLRAAQLEPALKRAREAASRLAAAEAGMAELSARATSRAAETRSVEARLAELGAVHYSGPEHDRLGREIHELRRLAQEAARWEALGARAPALEEAKRRAQEERAAISPLLEASVARLVELPAARERSTGARQACEATLAEFQRAMHEATRLEALGQGLVAEVQRLRAEVADLESKAKALQDEERELELLEVLAGDRDSGLLLQFKEHLVARVGPSLSAHASRLFCRMTDSRYPALDLDADYEPHVYDRGQRYPLERFSGGEVDLANLALRLAVSELVASKAGAALRFIALDEVFGSQDSVRRQNILRALKELAPRFDQVFVVTHIDEVKETSDHVLAVEAKPDGTSALAWL